MKFRQIEKIRKLSNDGEIALRSKTGRVIPIPGEPAAGQLRGGPAGAPAKAGERFAGAADREAGGEAADRSGRHRRLLLHRAAIAAPPPADPSGRGPDRVLDRVLDAFVPFDYRRRRLHAASSCFYRERRGDDADVR